MRTVFISLQFLSMRLPRRNQQRIICAKRLNYVYSDVERVMVEQYFGFQKWRYCMDGGTRPIGLCCSGSKPEEGDTGVDKSNIE